jgi:hypothetical protein
MSKDNDQLKPQLGPLFGQINLGRPVALVKPPEIRGPKYKKIKEPDGTERERNIYDAHKDLWSGTYWRSLGQAKKLDDINKSASFQANDAYKKVLHEVMQDKTVPLKLKVRTVLDRLAEFGFSPAERTVRRHIADLKEK